LHRIFCVVPELHVLEGAELGPMALALGMAKFGSLTPAHLLQWRLRNAGVERGQKWLPNAGASVSLALEER